MVVPEDWRLGLAIARTAIALVLVAAELYPQWYPLSTTGVIFICYLFVSIVSIFWMRRDHGSSDLLRLIVDVIMLLMCVVNPVDRSGWTVSFFFLYLLLSACILHHLREIAMVCGTVVLVTMLLGWDTANPLVPIVLAPSLLAMALGWQKRTIEARLSQSAKQTVMYRTEAENARELERQRIAADFHDGPLQSFISFQMRLEVIKKLLKRDQQAAVDDLTQLQDICRKQITDMRSFVRSMRMSADGATPVTNIRQIAEDFQKTSGIVLSWNVSDALSGLEPEISHEVLQIIREALHNAQKHSKASKVSLTAEKNESSLQINVDDDGSGFPFGGSYNLEELELMRMGPESIKRRVRTLSGDLQVESTPGRGSKIRIRIPV